MVAILVFAALGSAEDVVAAATGKVLTATEIGVVDAPWKRIAAPTTLSGVTGAARGGAVRALKRRRRSKVAAVVSSEP